MKNKIDFFNEIWSKKEVDLMKTKALWDSRAEEFSDHKGKERVHQVIDYLLSKGALSKDEEVLDIGCGAGKYALEFANYSENVIGVDISTNMINYANKHAKEKNVSNVEFKVLPWVHADVDDLGWSKKFNLVTAIMTPAISDHHCLKKMMDASKGYCIMSGHINKRESLKEEVEQNVLGQTHKENYNYYGTNLYCSFNILWNKGIYPEITYYDMKRENVMTVEEAYKYCCTRLEIDDRLDKEKMSEIKQYLKSMSKNGQIKNIFESKTAWLFWENK